MTWYSLPPPPFLRPARPAAAATATATTTTERCDGQSYDRMVLAVFENRRINERVKAYKLNSLYKCGPIKVSESRARSGIQVQDGGLRSFFFFFREVFVSKKPGLPSLVPGLATPRCHQMQGGNRKMSGRSAAGLAWCKLACLLRPGLWRGCICPVCRRPRSQAMKPLLHCTPTRPRRPQTRLIEDIFRPAASPFDLFFGRGRSPFFSCCLF